MFYSQTMRTVLLFLALCFTASALRGQSTADAIVYPAGGPAQTETDEYTRYELLAPETASFRIYYEVTATTAGAKYFYNPIRKGSVATDESVTDAMTGKPLVFAVVTGEEARKDPLMAAADAATDYIRVTLARPVPEHGQGRLIIPQNLQGPEELLHRRRGDRLQPAARHQAQQGRPARRLSGRRADSTVTDHAGKGRSPRHQLHARGRRRSPAGVARDEGRTRRQSRRGPTRQARRPAGNRPSPARPSAAAWPSEPTRTATSSTSCSSLTPTPSRSITTTPKAAPA